MKAYSFNVVHAYYAIPFNLPKEENFIYGTMQTPGYFIKCKGNGVMRPRTEWENGLKNSEIILSDKIR